MKVKEICEGFTEIGLTGEEDIEPVVDSGPVGSGDEWDVSDPVTGAHLGCLYDDSGQGYAYCAGAFAGDD